MVDVLLVLLLLLFFFFLNFQIFGVFFLLISLVFFPQFSAWVEIIKKKNKRNSTLTAGQGKNFKTHISPMVGQNGHRNQNRRSNSEQKTNWNDLYVNPENDIEQLFVQNDGGVEEKEGRVVAHSVYWRLCLKDLFPYFYNRRAEYRQKAVGASAVETHLSSSHRRNFEKVDGDQRGEEEEEEEETVAPEKCWSKLEMQKLEQEWLRQKLQKNSFAHAYYSKSNLLFDIFVFFFFRRLKTVNLEPWGGLFDFNQLFVSRADLKNQNEGSTLTAIQKFLNDEPPLDSDGTQFFPPFDPSATLFFLDKNTLSESGSNQSDRPGSLQASATGSHSSRVVSLVNLHQQKVFLLFQLYLCSFNSSGSDHQCFSGDGKICLKVCGNPSFAVDPYLMHVRGTLEPGSGKFESVEHSVESEAEFTVYYNQYFYRTYSFNAREVMYNLCLSLENLLLQDYLCEDSSFNALRHNFSASDLLNLQEHASRDGFGGGVTMTQAAVGTRKNAVRSFQKEMKSTLTNRLQDLIKRIQTNRGKNELIDILVNRKAEFQTDQSDILQDEMEVQEQAEEKESQCLWTSGTFKSSLSNFTFGRFSVFHNICFERTIKNGLLQKVNANPTSAAGVRSERPRQLEQLVRTVCSKTADVLYRCLTRLQYSRDLNALPTELDENSSGLNRYTDTLTVWGPFGVMCLLQEIENQLLNRLPTFKKLVYKSADVFKRLLLEDPLLDDDEDIIHKITRSVFGTDPNDATHSFWFNGGREAGLNPDPRLQDMIDTDPETERHENVLFTEILSKSVNSLVHEDQFLSELSKMVTNAVPISIEFLKGEYGSEWEWGIDSVESFARANFAMHQGQQQQQQHEQQERRQQSDSQRIRNDNLNTTWKGLKKVFSHMKNPWDFELQSMQEVTKPLVDYLVKFLTLRVFDDNPDQTKRLVYATLKYILSSQENGIRMIQPLESIGENEQDGSEQNSFSPVSSGFDFDLSDIDLGEIPQIEDPNSQGNSQFPQFGNFSQVTDSPPLRIVDPDNSFEAGDPWVTYSPPASIADPQVSEISDLSEAELAAFNNA